MTFDVVVGNPPYQGPPVIETATRTAYSPPKYPDFVRVSKALRPRYLSFIIPARWQTQPRLKVFRAEMLADRRLAWIADYRDEDMFPGVWVAGGFCVFLWARDHDGLCLVVLEGDISRATPRWLGELDVFVRDSHSMAIVRRVRHRMMEEGLQSMASRAWGGHPFGIRASRLPPGTSEGLSERCGVLVMTTKGDRFIRRDQVPRRRDWIDTWKVVVSATRVEFPEGSKLVRGSISRRSRVLPPPSVCVAPYYVVDTFGREVQARNAFSTLTTRFCRFLLSLIAVNKHLSREHWAFVPVMPADRAWTDEDLAGFFDLSRADVAHIESKIRAWPS